MKITQFFYIGSLALSIADEPVIVTANSYTGVADPIDSIEKIEEVIASTPGGASVIWAEDSIVGTGYNTKEILAFTPGVFAKENSVPLDARLSVRGGGATRGFGSRGVTLLIDGVPTNLADGSYYSRGYDGSNISYVEAFRGANGLARGGQSLGGTINFAQKNGKTDPGFTYFVEGGSFNLFRQGATYGYSEGKLDAFVSVSRGESDGFRDFQGWEQDFINANIGYQWNEDVSTRVYLLHVDSDVQLASTLSFDQFEDDPSQAVNSGDLDRDVSQTRVAQKTSFSSGDTEGLFYTFYQRTDFDHLISADTFRPGITPNLIRLLSNDFGAGIRTETNFNHFTLRTDNAITYAELENTSIEGFAPQTGQEDTDDTFFNLKLYGELEYAVNDRLSVFGGLGFIYSTRERVVGPDDETNNIDFDEDYAEFLPRVGLLYKLSEEVSLYANYSRNFEAPASSEASTAAPEAAIGSTADSFEIGSRFSNNKIKGELSAFYSIVSDEFTNDAVLGATPPLSFVTSPNADAVYSGVELAGSATLYGDGFGSTGLFLDANYIYSNYFFTSGVDEGQSLDGNEIPGLPQHSLNLRLKYQHEKGHELAFTMEAASGLFYDLLNTDVPEAPQSPEYAIFHLTGKYKVTDYLELYGGVRNLFDENFVNSVVIENGPDAFSPGDGRNFFVGAKFSF